jgi:hypothetical protein
MKMRLGNMSFRNLASRISPQGSPVRRESPLPAPKLTALTLLLLVGVLLGGAVTGLAKEKKPPSKTVSGVVMDEADNFIQGATVELTDLQTRKVLDIYSQEGGQYQFADLRLDHDYTVQARYKNSSSQVRKVSSFDTRTRPVLNLTLHKPNK